MSQGSLVCCLRLFASSFLFSLYDLDLVLLNTNSHHYHINQLQFYFVVVDAGRRKTVRYHPSCPLRAAQPIIVGGRGDRASPLINSASFLGRRGDAASIKDACLVVSIILSLGLRVCVLLSAEWLENFSLCYLFFTLTNPFLPRNPHQKNRPYRIPLMGRGRYTLPQPRIHHLLSLPVCFHVLCSHGPHRSLQKDTRIPFRWRISMISLHLVSVSPIFYKRS